MGKNGRRQTIFCFPIFLSKFPPPSLLLSPFVCPTAGSSWRLHFFPHFRFRNQMISLIIFQHLLFTPAYWAKIYIYTRGHPFPCPSIPHLIVSSFLYNTVVIFLRIFVLCCMRIVAVAFLSPFLFPVLFLGSVLSQVWNPNLRFAPGLRFVGGTYIYVTYLPVVCLCYLLDIFHMISLVLFDLDLFYL